jgi:hypothetical protein
VPPSTEYANRRAPVSRCKERFTFLHYTLSFTKITFSLQSQFQSSWLLSPSRRSAAVSTGTSLSCFVDAFDWHLLALWKTRRIHHLPSRIIRVLSTSFSLPICDLKSLSCRRRADKQLVLVTSVCPTPNHLYIRHKIASRSTPHVSKKR